MHTHSETPRTGPRRAIPLLPAGLAEWPSAARGCSRSWTRRRRRLRRPPPHQPCRSRHPLRRPGSERDSKPGRACTEGSCLYLCLFFVCELSLLLPRWLVTPVDRTSMQCDPRRSMFERTALFKSICGTFLVNALFCDLTYFCEMNRYARTSSLQRWRYCHPIR